MGALRQLLQIVCDTLVYLGTFMYFSWWQQPISKLEVFGKERLPVCHVYTLAQTLQLWDAPHYRASSFAEDLRANLRNVATPGTGGGTWWRGNTAALTAAAAAPRSDKVRHVSLCRRHPAQRLLLQQSHRTVLHPGGQPSHQPGCSCLPGLPQTWLTHPDGRCGWNEGLLHACVAWQRLTVCLLSARGQVRPYRAAGHAHRDARAHGGDAGRAPGRLQPTNWDVALTPEGVYLLELNISCNLFRGAFDSAAFYENMFQHFVALEELEAQLKKQHRAESKPATYTEDCGCRAADGRLSL